MRPRSIPWISGWCPEAIRRIAAARMFLDEESQGLAQLGDFIGKPISLQVETLYTQEQYDIVLI